MMKKNNPHAPFVTITHMLPDEYKNGGSELTISYAYYPTTFGEILIASTSKGICYVAFENEEKTGIQTLQHRYPKAQYIKQQRDEHKNAISFFEKDKNNLNKIALHLHGTAFQLKVWGALLKIPFGSLTTYKQIAHQIDQEGASRAVGNAIGANPIAYLIPCHRVIQQSGSIGGYRWGTARKSILIDWENTSKE